MHLCVCVPWTCLGSAFGEIYANCCCLNTRGPPRPFHPTQHITTGRPSNKASRLVSLPLGPLTTPHNPPHSVPALPPSLAMRHGSTDDRLMRRKYFYRITFRMSPENQWQRFYGHQLTGWALLSLYLLWLYGQASCYACLTQTTAYWLALNLGLKGPPQTSRPDQRPFTHTLNKCLATFVRPAHSAQQFLWKIFIKSRN